MAQHLNSGADRQNGRAAHRRALQNPGASEGVWWPGVARSPGSAERVQVQESGTESDSVISTISAAMPRRSSSSQYDGVAAVAVGAITSGSTSPIRTVELIASAPEFG